MKHLSVVGTILVLVTTSLAAPGPRQGNRDLQVSVRLEDGHGMLDDPLGPCYRLCAQEEIKCPEGWVSLLVRATRYHKVLIQAM